MARNSHERVTRREDDNNAVIKLIGLKCEPGVGKPEGIARSIHVRC